MKKAIKLISLLMALILTLGLFTGCTESNLSVEDDGDLETLTMTVGVPADSSNTDWREIISLWMEDMELYYTCDLKIVSVPTEEAGYKDFMKKVDRGEIAMFIAEPSAMTEQLRLDESLVEVDTIQKEYTALYDDISEAALDLAMEEDTYHWAYPLSGSYQGLYYNTEIFEQHQIAVPTNWAELLTAVEGLKTAGVTPIAAGFADEGLNYMVDELILSEGGVADHSYQPTFGIVSSWERAIQHLKELETAGAFTSDCYNNTFDNAVDSFLNGQAAMIVAPSTAFNGALDLDTTGFMGLPATSTGKRGANAIVGELEYGVYFSLKYYQKQDERYMEALIDLLNDDYITSPDLYNMLKDEGTFSAVKSYYDDAENNIEECLGEILTAEGSEADLPMSKHLYTFDNLVDAFRNVLTGADMETELLAAAQTEIQAAEEAEAQETEKD